MLSEIESRRKDKAAADSTAACRMNNRPISPFPVVVDTGKHYAVESGSWPRGACASAQVATPRSALPRLPLDDMPGLLKSLAAC